MYELFTKLRSSLLPEKIIDTYQIYHDCGKPFCLEIDENGKRHYPDHANISANIWLSLEEKSKHDDIIADLMRHDMDFHTLRGDELTELWKNYLAPTLYFTAWAELFANSKMFGGTESDSFKIKKKRLIQAGKKL
jgi:hypothetical protein